MTTFVHFGLASSVSLLAVMYLLLIDRKRRRVLRLAEQSRVPQLPVLGWLAVLLPGTVLFGLEQYGAFLAWCGAITVPSWLMVITSSGAAVAREDRT